MERYVKIKANVEVVKTLIALCNALVEQIIEDVCLGGVPQGELTEVAKQADLLMNFIQGLAAEFLDDPEVLEWFKFTKEVEKEARAKMRGKGKVIRGLFSEN